MLTNEVMTPIIRRAPVAWTDVLKASAENSFLLMNVF